MGTEWWTGPEPKTKFAPKFKVPLYVATDGTQEFVDRLYNYVLKVENEIIAKEALVSEVPKPEHDPYQHTQQWKQHNLLKDFAGKDGNNLERFPSDPVQDELFNLIRTNYLVHLANLNYPRIKAYVHCWANVLQKGQWISRHNHMCHESAYLAGTYYLTGNATSLYMENPMNPKDIVQVATEKRKMVLFPSYLQHWSDVCHEEYRVSIAFDVVLDDTVFANPFRPHILLDDPTTMPGLDGK